MVAAVFLSSPGHSQNAPLPDAPGPLTASSPTSVPASVPSALTASQPALDSSAATPVPSAIEPDNAINPMNNRSAGNRSQGRGTAGRPMSNGQAQTSAANWQRTFADLYRIGAGYALGSVPSAHSFNLNRASGSLFQLGNDLGGDIGGSTGASVGTAFHFLEKAGQIERSGLSIPLNSNLFSQSPLHFGEPAGMRSDPDGMIGGHNSPASSSGSRFQWTANMNIGGFGESDRSAGSRSMFTSSSTALPGGDIFGGSGPASANRMAAGMATENGMGGSSVSGLGGPGASGGGKSRPGVSGPSLSLHLSF